jgi:hypothetical protein
MSREAFDDTCPGCRPVLLTLNGQPLPADSKPMLALAEVWQSLSLKERQAFHDFCCLNQHTKENFSAMSKIAERLRAQEAYWAK